MKLRFCTVLLKYKLCVENQSFPVLQRHRRSRDGSGSIVCDYGLDDWVIGVRSPAGAKDFSSVLCVQISSGDHPASCPVGTRGPFPGGKVQLGHDPDHSPHLVLRS
jgi:hypothetical protein